MNRLLTNWHIKLICVLLAFGLWFFVAHLSQERAQPKLFALNVSQILGVPVRLQGEQTTNLTLEPSQIAITVEWRRQDPVPYSALRSIYAVIPVESVDSKQLYSLSARNLVLPPGWRVLEIHPSEITLKPTSQGE